MGFTGTLRELPQTGDKGNAGARRATRRWIANTTAKTDTIVSLMDEASLPDEGDAFPGDSSMVCKQVKYDQNEKLPTQWLVTAEYERPQPDGGGGGPGSSDGNIENEIPEYTVSSEFLTEYMDIDLDEVPIKNSSGEFLAPGLERIVNIAVYTISRNRLEFPDGESIAYRNSVNDGAFAITATAAYFGFPARTALLTRYDGVRRFRADIGYYWRVTWEIKYRADGWRKRLLDQGFLAKDDTDPEAGDGTQAPNKVIVGKNGLPLNGPVLLDGAGNPLAEGGTPIFLPLDGPGFRIFEEKDFSILPLSIT